MKVDRHVVNAVTQLSTAPNGGPIFIIGPPRSGTTLTYQLLTQCLDVGYITNFESRFPYAPLVGGSLCWWARLRHPGRSSNFESDYGKTQGEFGPNESGQLWYRWFPAGENVYVRSGELPEADRADMRRYVHAIRKMKGNRTLCFKNVYHSARIGALKETFPDAVFLVVERPIIDVAQSILRARRNVGNGKHGWWSIPLPPPIGIPTHLDWAEQVVRQVNDIYEEIDSQRKLIGEEAFLEIDYHVLCNNPGGMIERVNCFLSERGIDVAYTGTPPRAFPIQGRTTFDRTDLDAMRQALSRISNSGTRAK